jgi:hypothetical protein
MTERRKLASNNGGTPKRFHSYESGLLLIQIILNKKIILALWRFAQPVGVD